MNARGGLLAGRIAGFTLFEILVAFAILTTGLTLMAAALQRHLAALQLLQTSLSARPLADRQLVGEILRRSEEIEIPPEPADPRYTPGFQVTSAPLGAGPAKDLEMERVTSQVGWSVRAQPRLLETTVGFHKKE